MNPVAVSGTAENPPQPESRIEEPLEVNGDRRRDSNDDSRRGSERGAFRGHRGRRPSGTDEPGKDIQAHIAI